MAVIKSGALERYSLRMGRLVERHLAEAALIAAQQEALREAAQARQAKAEIEIAAVALRQEITVRETAQARLAYLARHDPLTGLPNRSWFGESLTAAVKAAEAAGGKLAVLYIDLDNFKDVNDTLGHEIGDALLRQVAARIAGSLPEGAGASRIGGDEFALVLPNLADQDAAIALGQSLITALCQPFEIEGRPSVLAR
jgi:diguanylate cyclase (GGDEF)-like protein